MSLPSLQMLSFLTHVLTGYPCWGCVGAVSQRSGGYESRSGAVRKALVRGDDERTFVRLTSPLTLVVVVN